jgi:hypothetical protein
LVYSREQRWFPTHWFAHENRDSSRTVGVLAVQSPHAAASPRKVCILILLLVSNVKIPPVLTEAVILLTH